MLEGSLDEQHNKVQMKHELSPCFSRPIDMLDWIVPVEDIC